MANLNMINFSRVLSTFLSVLLIFGWPISANAQNSKKCSSFFKKITASKNRHFHPALELAEKGSEYDRFFWKRFSEDFQEQTRKEISRNRDFFEKAKARGDAHLLFLESLGFVFNFSEYKVYVPPLLEIFQKIQFQIQKNIETGLIDPQDALFPKMVVTAVHAEHFNKFYGNKNPEIDASQVLRGHLVVPGGRLPIINYFIENSSFYESTNFLSDKDFHRLISSGFFPVGGLRAANVGGRYILNEIMHDLAHWSAMILEPSYMAAVKRKSERLYRKNLKQVEIESFLLDFIAYESMMVVPPERLKEVPEFLGLGELFTKNRNPSFEEIENYYSRMSEQNLLKTTEVMREHFFKIFVAVGGAQRDLVSFNNLPDFQFPHLRLFNDAAGSELFPGKDPNKMAIFSYFVLQTKDLSSGQFLELLTTESNRNHPAVRIILELYKKRRR